MVVFGTYFCPRLYIQRSYVVVRDVKRSLWWNQLHHFHMLQVGGNFF